MPFRTHKEAASEFRRLERRNAWMWGLAVLLLVTLGTAVAIVYLTQVAAPTDLFPAAETRGTLAGALCGVIALFCLYMIVKQRELQRLRVELIQAHLQEESLRSRLLGLSSLLEGITQVATHLDLEAVLENLAEHVRATMRADQVSIMLIEPETRELECRAVVGLDAEFVRGARVPLGQGISGWVAKYSQALVLDQEEVAARFPGQIKMSRNIATALCVPLSHPEQVIGVININRLGRALPYTKDDAGLLTVFGAHAAIAIRRIAEKKQDEHIRQTQKMEALGRLAGGIAHDFNNLLTVILSYSTKLAGIDGTYPPDPAAVKIREAAERCASLTRQLLAFGNRQIVQAEPLDLNARVAGLRDLLQRAIREDISLVTMLSPEPARVAADPDLIDQIIVNLVLNARDGMPQGGIVTLETAIVEVDPEAVREHAGMVPGSYAVLRVRDTGEGMEAEALNRVFEPFSAARGHGVGSGLGLATVYAIATQNGGHVTAASEPGTGSLFHVYLPSLPSASAARADRGRRAPSRGETILLLEDEEVLRDLAREVLEAHGYEVLGARHGLEAIQICDHHEGRVDLLLTDVIMPGMSGPEVAERLRRDRPRLKVLFMSGYAGDVLDQHGVATTATGFLQKPFTPDGLLIRVRHALASPPAPGTATLDQAA